MRAKALCDARTRVQRSAKDDADRKSPQGMDAMMLTAAAAITAPRVKGQPAVLLTVQLSVEVTLMWMSRSIRMQRVIDPSVPLTNLDRE